MRGRLLRLHHRSERLADNPWGDPAERELLVYVPAAVERGTPAPLVFALAGFTGTGHGFVNRRWREESLVERLDRLIAEGMPGLIVAMPDPLTALGGGQYLDSPAVGAYASWLAEELLPWTLARFDTTGRVGLVGRSSGGFGALTLPTLFPGRFHAVAAHSPDAAFEVAYPPDFPAAVETLRDAGGPGPWLDAFLGRSDLKSSDHAVLNLLAMACAYSPEPGRRPLPAELPVDLDTGALRPEVFDRWLAWDPLRRLPAHAESLRSLEGLLLDVGRRDEFRLQVGARLLHRALDAAGVPHAYEEHEGGHFKLNARFDRSLPFLARALSGAQG